MKKLFAIIALGLAVANPLFAEGGETCPTTGTENQQPAPAPETPTETPAQPEAGQAN